MKVDKGSLVQMVMIIFPLLAGFREAPNYIDDVKKKTCFFSRISAYFSPFILWGTKGYTSRLPRQKAPRKMIRSHEPEGPRFFVWKFGRMTFVVQSGKDCFRFE